MPSKNTYADLKQDSTRLRSLNGELETAEKPVLKERRIAGFLFMSYSACASCAHTTQASATSAQELYP